MKITINQKNLKKALNTVEKAVSKNLSLPILNNILLKTENGRLKISATNLEIGINYFIGGKIDEVGEITVPSRIFIDFINNVDDEKVNISTKNNILTINTNRFKTQILGHDPKDFPIIPKIKDGSEISIHSKELREPFLCIVDSIAISETRPELSGAFIKIEKTKITMASTDSFRLAEVFLNCKNGSEISFILPRNTLLELIRVLSDIDNNIKVKIGENQISFHGDDFELISRLIDGNYPDYKKVIPDKFSSKVLVKKDELERSIRLAGLFSSNISDIKLSCNEKNLIINAKNSDKGEVNSSVDCVLKNNPFEISLNYNYLIDGLKIIPTDKVIIEYTGSGSPLVVKPENNERNIVYIIMPLRN